MGDKETVPMWKTGALDPLSNFTLVLPIEVMEENRETEQTMWFVAPVSKIQGTDAWTEMRLSEVPKNVAPGWEIPTLLAIEWEWLSKLSSFLHCSCVNGNPLKVGDVCNASEMSLILS